MRMFVRIAKSIVLFAALFLLLTGRAEASTTNQDAANVHRRIALVVGNSNYRYVTTLTNPDNDARLVARTLRSLGFTLVGDRERTDLDRLAFDQAIEEFGDSIRGADVALFYYAGHGLRVRGDHPRCGGDFPNCLIDRERTEIAAGFA
jgi:Caspase domain